MSFSPPTPPTPLLSSFHYTACATLANLAELKLNQDTIADEGAIRPCITVMRSKYIEVQREAGRLLGIEYNFHST